MRREQTESVREITGARREEGTAPLRRLPTRTTRTTKHMHERLLKALGDRRIKRAFD